MAKTSKRKKQAAKKPVPKKKAAPAAKPKPVPTQEAAAIALGVNRRTLIEWSKKPGFPDTAKGWNPIAIREWADIAGYGGSKRKDGDREEMHAVRLDREKIARDREALKFQQELGQLLNIDDVTRLVERVISTTKSVLEQLPDKLEQHLSPMLDAATKTRHRKATLKILHESYAIIQQMLEGDEDKEDDEENT